MSSSAPRTNSRRRSKLRSISWRWRSHARPFCLRPNRRWVRFPGSPTPSRLSRRLSNPRRPMPDSIAEMSPEQKDDEQPPEEMRAMGFLEHLEELRRRLIYSILSVGAGFVVCWTYHERIYTFMQRPIMEALHKNGMAEKL